MYNIPCTYVFSTADSVLIREVSFIQTVFYREVPLYVVGKLLQYSVSMSEMSLNTFHTGLHLMIMN